MIKPIKIKMPLGTSFPTVNIWLVPGDELCLIDAGAGQPGNFEILKKEVERNGYKLSDIKKVFITHEHPDHIGLLPKILEETDATIWCDKMVSPWLEDYLKERKRTMDFFQSVLEGCGLPKSVFEIMTAKSTGNVQQIQVPLSRLRYIDSDTKINIGGLEFKAIHTPGHSVAHFIFFNKENRLVFGGDLLLDKVSFPTVREHPETNGKRFAGLSAYIESLELLKSLKVKKLFPGHGDINLETNKRIEEQIKRIHQRKEECLNLINSGCETIYAIYQKMYSNRDGMLLFAGMLMVLGYTDLLLEEGKIIASQGKQKETIFTISKIGLNNFDNI